MCTHYSAHSTLRLPVYSPLVSENPDDFDKKATAKSSVNSNPLIFDTCSIVTCSMLIMLVLYLLEIGISI